MIGIPPAQGEGGPGTPGPPGPPGPPQSVASYAAAANQLVLAGATDPIALALVETTGPDYLVSPTDLQLPDGVYKLDMQIYIEPNVQPVVGLMAGVVFFLDTGVTTGFGVINVAKNGQLFATTQYMGGTFTVSGGPLTFNVLFNPVIIDSVYKGNTAVGRISITRFS